MMLPRYILAMVLGVSFAEAVRWRPRDDPQEESHVIPGVPTVVVKTIFGRYHGDLRPVFRGDPKTRVKEKYIVMLRSGSTRTTLDRVIDQFQKKVDLVSRVAKKFGLHLDLGEISDVMDQLLMVIVARLPVVALTIMRTLRDVDFIEEVQTVAACSEEWHLDRLDQLTLPLDLGKFQRNGEGSSVDVYVLDSGIRYSHEEFEGRATWSGYDAFDPDGTNQGADLNDHGTHVAALVGGRRFGVARGVRLRSVRVLDDLGNGDSSTILLGINHVAKQVNSSPAGRRSVVVMSLRGSRNVGNASTLNQMARELVVATGTPVVAAAGNDGRDACKFVPGSEDEVITVGGTNPVDGTYRRTNFGRCVDILAPAARVRSAGAECDTCSRVSSGTSQAAPLVAGVVVAMLDDDPSLTPAQIRMKLLEDAVSDRIDLSRLPRDMRLQTANKLLHIPARSAFQPRVTPACRTVWSIKSGGADGDLSSVACNVNETIMGCSSLAADEGMRAGEFNTELPGVRQACVATNGAGGTGVYAIARCCSWPGARCYFRDSGKSSSRDNAEVKAKCDRTLFSCDMLVGCSASSETGFIDGVRPERSRLLGLIPSSLRKCAAQNGKGGSGVTAHATCCKSRDMKCQAVWSDKAKAGETQVDAKCPSGTLLTGCNVYEKDGQAEGAYPRDTPTYGRVFP
ncbi:proprotein convertase subtilisin/kexin type 9-like [Branchiostoma floridae]|uniref:Proprotein convertase subtilisin/kexin type 9-like n=1 Tax=Branchiostoma floridae TaxID=7739 RepID=A0A9J7N446_BRAFL|nr:proprotein convertase subtilisin/kexin type 9-like [Branchiostoma floridae]